MSSKKQRWARERNFLIWRVKGIIAHDYAIRRFLPDDETQGDIDVILSSLKKVLRKLKSLDEYEKYQRYLGR